MSVHPRRSWLAGLAAVGLCLGAASMAVAQDPVDPAPQAPSVLDYYEGDLPTSGQVTYGGEMGAVPEAGLVPVYYYNMSPGPFWNYYSAPVYGGPTAQMYLSPRPTPPWVGHTFYTYPPFYPHHYLWHHNQIWTDGYRNARVSYR